MLFRSGDSPLVLGTLGGDDSFAYDINDNGIIVGASTRPDRRQAPFIYKISEGKMKELLSGGLIGAAHAINKDDKIVGTLKNSDGFDRAVIWFLDRWVK